VDPTDTATATSAQQPDGQGAPLEPGAGDGSQQGPSTELMPRDDAEEDVRSEIEQPAKLMRIAMTVQTLFQEVTTTELDEAGRVRLTEIHNRIVEELRELVSSNLEAELEALTLESQDGPPSGGELRVTQAQLAGWLQGVFHGIQASVASQQMAAQQQLAQMQRQGAGEGANPRSGQYL